MKATVQDHTILINFGSDGSLRGVLRDEGTRWIEWQNGTVWKAMPNNNHLQKPRVISGTPDFHSRSRDPLVYSSASQTTYRSHMSPLSSPPRNTPEGARSNSMEVLDPFTRRSRAHQPRDSPDPIFTQDKPPVHDIIVDIQAHIEKVMANAAFTNTTTTTTLGLEDPLQKAVI